MCERVIPLRHEADAGSERRSADRRRADRRAPRRTLDSLFAATLVSQRAPQERVAARRYPAPPPLRAGVVVNTRV